MNLDQVLKKPVVTEKATESTAWGKYSFWVDKQATKKEISQAVKKFFGVQVLKVQTTMMPGKRKKAIVQLAEGEKIDLFETGG